MQAFENSRRFDSRLRFVFCSIHIPKGSSTELSADGIAYVRRLFRKYDEVN